MKVEDLDIKTLEHLKLTAEFYSDSSARTLLYGYIKSAIEKKSVTELNGLQLYEGRDLKTKI